MLSVAELLQFGACAIYVRVLLCMDAILIALILVLCQEVILMHKRSKMSRGFSKKLFRVGAQRVHPKNGLGMSSSSFNMRGGIRL